jgi:protein TonB
MMRTFALAGLMLTLAACDAGPPRPLTEPAGGYAPPVAVDTPPPAYPESLACAGVGGVVQLRVDIEVDGHIRQVQIQQGSGNAELDAVAAKAVRGWTFRPATQAGKPVAKWIAVPMTFHVPQPRPQHCFVLDEERRDALKAK